MLGSQRLEASLGEAVAQVRLLPPGFMSASMRAQLAFTATTTGIRPMGVFDLARSNTFAARSNPRANRRAGADPAFTIVPRELVPTNRFRFELRARLPALSGPRLPFRVEVGGQSVDLTVALKHFPPMGLQATVGLKTFLVNEPQFPASLLRFEEARTQDPVAGVLRRSLGMMRDGDHRRYSPVPQPSVLTAMQIVLPSEQPVRPWVAENLGSLVALLLRASPADLSAPIVQKVAAECDMVNEKETHTYTLIVQRSLVHVSSEQAVGGRYRLVPNFRTLVETQAQAASLAGFLREYLQLRDAAPEAFDFYLDLAVKWISRPLTHSVSGTLVWRRLCSVMGIADEADRVLAIPGIASRLNQYAEVFARLQRGYWRDDALELRIVDEVRRNGGIDLSFVEDQEVRRSIEQGFVRTQHCMQAREYGRALTSVAAIAESLTCGTDSDTHGSRCESAHGGPGTDSLPPEGNSGGSATSQAVRGLVQDWLRLYGRRLNHARDREAAYTNESEAQLAIQAVAVLARQLAAVYDSRQGLEHGGTHYGVSP